MKMIMEKHHHQDLEKMLLHFHYWTLIVLVNICIVCVYGLEKHQTLESYVVSRIKIQDMLHKKIASS